MEKNQPKEDEFYDPHDHRNIPKAITYFQALVNLLKASIGIGVLAMPLAFANAGYVPGVIFMVIIGLICLHGLHMLIGSMYELCKRRRVPYLIYADAMKAGLEDGPRVFKCLLPIAKPMVDFFMLFYHFGACSVCLIFVAETAKQIIDQWIKLHLRIHLCIVAVPIGLIFTIRNLKLLAKFSACANVLLIVGFGFLGYFVFDDMPPIASRKLLVDDITRIPFYIGTVLFALESIGAALAIEESMKKPKEYVSKLGVLNVDMAIVVALYTLVGFFGYWKYGADSLGSVTLNIPQDEILAEIIKALFGLAVVVTYQLQGFVVVRILWFNYLIPHVADKSKHFLYEELARFTILILSLCAALALPNLGTFLSLIGAFALSSLGLIFPAVLQMCVHYKMGYGPYKLLLIKNVFVLSFGLFGCAVGTASSIRDIVEEFFN